MFEPDEQRGMADSILASVLAVAIWPSWSTRSMVPVGKYGKMSVSDLAQ